MSSLIIHDSKGTRLVKQFHFSQNKIYLDESTIALVESDQTNVTIMNCLFKKSSSKENGVVLSTLSMMSAMNHLQLLNNTFQDNSCKKHAGLFFFKEAQYKIIAIGNSYMNNKAKLSGGIGYIYKSNLWYSEEDGHYKSIYVNILFNNYL